MLSAEQVERGGEGCVWGNHRIVAEGGRRRGGRRMENDGDGGVRRENDGAGGMRRAEEGNE